MWERKGFSQKKNGENSRNTEIPWTSQNKKPSCFYRKRKFFVVSCRAEAPTNIYFQLYMMC